MDKNELREWAKSLRAGTSERGENDTKKLVIAAQAAIQTDMDSGLRRSDENLVVATYYPIGTEIVPPHELSNTQMALPVIRNKTTLEFYPWSVGEPLVKRDFNIPIPDTRGLSPVTPDIILLPLLLCDKHGNRIGYGAGHYDRYIASCTPKPLLIGVCFDEQIYDGDIPAEPHDQKLDLIMTPKRTIAIPPLPQGEGNET